MVNLPHKNRKLLLMKILLIIEIIKIILTIKVVVVIIIIIIIIIITIMRILSKYVKQVLRNAGSKQVQVQEVKVLRKPHVKQVLCTNP